MSNIAVRAEHLSKRYRLGSKDAPYKTLRESLTNLPRILLRGTMSGRRDAEGRKAESREIWAVDDVSFDIAHGEVIGFVGRNGAGKSTLLKILSRITEPTAGQAEVYGRLGSLLEVGTGFHPELTGRENIYLNGAILGMSRGDIRRRFDEIVDFAELERFLDTPVKRYSSGMYMRLAFAVAAHLEPEILVIDEVLAVGDAAFQSKCLKRMGDLSHEGRTVIFVSHNLPSVRALCNRCFLIDHGRLVAGGPAGQIVDQYLATTMPDPVHRVDLSTHPGRLYARNARLEAIWLAFGPARGQEWTFLPMGGDLTVTVTYRSPQPLPTPNLHLIFKNSSGAEVLHLTNRFAGTYPLKDLVTDGTVTCTLSNCPFVPGRYTIDMYFGHSQDRVEDFDAIENAISFDVQICEETIPTGIEVDVELGQRGVVILPSEWTFVQGVAP